MTGTVLATEIDLFAADVITEPYATYRELRDIGPAVWMSRYDCWVLPRYAEVAAALRDYQTFSSAAGVMLNDLMNQATKGSMLCSDPPEHDRLRRILGLRLTPRALKGHREDFHRRARVLVDHLVEKKSFDVTEFSQEFPLSVVPDLVGCPADGRNQMLGWASAGFQIGGPMNERAMADLAKAQEFLGYTRKLAAEGALVPGSWGSQMVEETRANEIDESQLPALIVDYLGPSIDTTISALSTAVWQLGHHPGQWEELRNNPGRVDNLISEAVRFEAPIRGFARHVTRDHVIGDHMIAAGDRVFISFASANRDERRWDRPDEFDIHRSTAGHVGFGAGVHSCVGQFLAKLETEALFTALAHRVRRIEVGQPVWRVHNMLRNIESMPVTLYE